MAVVILVGYFLRYRASEPEVEFGELPSGGGSGTLPSAPAQSGRGGDSAGGVVGSITAPVNQVSDISDLSAEKQRFGVVAQNPTVDYFIDSENTVTLVQPDGKIAKIERGESSFISSSEINDVQGASFSHDGKKILVTFGDRLNIQASVFDIKNKSWNPLPAGSRSPGWSPIDYRIVYFSQKNGRGSLSTVDMAKEKSSPVDIMKLNALDMRLDWVERNRILVSDKSNALFFGFVTSLNLSNKSISPVLERESGIESAWSPALGLGLMLSSAREWKSGKLTLFKLSDNSAKEITLNTLPSKCAFATEEEEINSASPASTSTQAPKTEKADVVYCAVPRDFRLFATYSAADDYYKKSIYSIDDFYRVNLKNGGVESVFADQAQFLDAINLKVFDQNLFFVNRYDLRLYAISLK